MRSNKRLRFLEISTLLLDWERAYLAPSIQMYGTPGDLERLAGEWSGEYTGDRAHVRRGTIMFKLVAGERVAHGDVRMTPDGVDRPSQRYSEDEKRLPREREHGSRVLTIRFVNAMDGVVNGELDPYWDPDRKTQASATFRGRMADEVIEGTFITRYANGSAERGGRWRATIRCPSATA